MVKKLKALAGGASADSEFAQTVRESAQQIWLAGLGAFAKAQASGTKFQAEGMKMLEALWLRRLLMRRRRCCGWRGWVVKRSGLLGSMRWRGKHM